MLIALNKTAEMVTANESLSKKELFYCPSCKNRVCLKAGQIIRPHFAHYQNENCTVFSEGETREHLDGKIQLANYLKTETRNIQLEAYLPYLQQRPDILLEKNNRKIAVEFQCSSISIEKIVERTQGYLKAGYEVVWILGNYFMYTNKLTSFHKACLYSSIEHRNPLLFHYDVQKEILSVRYDFQLTKSGTMRNQLNKVMLNEKESIELMYQETVKRKREITESFDKKHNRLMREVRYPSLKMREFLQLIYQNQENIISMPKELYLSLPSEWVIKNHQMSWKYLFVLWIESYPKKKILTMKMLRLWLRNMIQAEEIRYYESPQLEETQLLKPFIEFIQLLEKRKVLREIGSLKWSYQQPLKRYKNLEEKFKCS